MKVAEIKTYPPLTMLLFVAQRRVSVFRALATFSALLMDSGKAINMQFLKIMQHSH